MNTPSEDVHTPEITVDDSHQNEEVSIGEVPNKTLYWIILL